MEIATYTHFIAAIISLLLAVFLIFQNNHLKIRIFFVLAVLFASFAIVDVYPLPSVLLVLAPCILAATTYFLYCLIKREDLPFYAKTLGAFPLLIPVILNAPIYSTIVGWAYISIALFFAIEHSIRDRGVRGEKITTSLGCLAFMFLFFVTQNPFTKEFLSHTFAGEYLEYSFYILPLLLGVLAYLAVRFKSYRIRILTNQIFILSVFVLIISLFFFIESTVAIVLNICIIFFMAIISHIIMESVSDEIRVREQVENLVHSLMQSNQNSKKTNIKLEELSLQKTEFISLATHQLRGPLSSISGYMSMILDGDFGKVDGHMREAILTVFKNSQSMIAIVNDYLNISRIELGKMEYTFSNFDVAELAESIVEDFKPVFTRTKLTIELIHDKNQTYMVKADLGKIKQVIFNLIDNSVKYTPTGKVSVCLDKKDANIIISIRDTGVGIDPEVMPHLFARFSRAPDASKTNILGTGLGLFVVKKLVEAHGGKVWAESEGAGKGAQFYVQLKEV